jgi:hypothetical protein
MANKYKKEWGAGCLPPSVPPKPQPLHYQILMSVTDCGWHSFCRDAGTLLIIILSCKILMGYA